MSNFGVNVLAASSLADTEIKVEGSVSTGYTPDYDRLGEKWAKDKHGTTDIGVKSYLTSTIIKPVATDLKLNLNPEAVAHHAWDNTEGTESATYSAGVSSNVTNETSVEWSESLTTELSVSIEGGTPFGKVNADASVSTTVGHSASKSKTSSVSSDSSVSVTVDGGKAEVAVLLLKKGELSFTLSLIERLQGYIEVLLEAGTDLIRVDASELQQYFNPKIYLSQVSFGFAIDSEIKTVTLPNADDDTIKAAIDDELNKYGNQKVSSNGGTPVGYIADAKTNLDDATGNLNSALGLLA